MDIYGGTAILVIAATLLCAAVAKTRHLRSFELSLVRLLPRTAWRDGFTSRSLACAVIMTELGTAAALFLAPEPWLTALTAWAAMLLAVLTGAAIIMMRRRVPLQLLRHVVQPPPVAGRGTQPRSRAAGVQHRGPDRIRRTR